MSTSSPISHVGEVPEPATEVSMRTSGMGSVAPVDPAELFALGLRPRVVVELLFLSPDFAVLGAERLAVLVPRVVLDVLGGVVVDHDAEVARLGRIAVDIAADLLHHVDGRDGTGVLRV